MIFLISCNSNSFRCTAFNKLFNSNSNLLKTILDFVFEVFQRIASKLWFHFYDVFQRIFYDFTIVCLQSSNQFPLSKAHSCLHTSFVSNNASMFHPFFSTALNRSLFAAELFSSDESKTRELIAWKSFSLPLAWQVTSLKPAYRWQSGLFQGSFVSKELNYILCFKVESVLAESVRPQRSFVLVMTSRLCSSSI
jgi:hypothetical protein